MRKLVLMIALLSVVSLTACGGLKRDGLFNRKQNTEVAQNNVGQASEPFVTSSPMFTPKEDVKPFVTSQPMYKFKRDDDRHNPHLLDKVMKSETAGWFVEQIKNAPVGYDVNYYKKKAEAAKQKPVEDTTTYAYDDFAKKGQVQDLEGNDVQSSVDNPNNVAVDAPIEPAEAAIATSSIASDDDKIVGIDSNTVAKSATAVPAAEDVDEAYKDMKYGKKGYKMSEAMDGDDDASSASKASNTQSSNYGTMKGRVYFDHGSAKIKPEDSTRISQISSDLKAKEKYKVNVIGHASVRVDGVSDEEVKEQINNKIASLRATRVKNELRNNGVKSDMILTVSKGDSEANPDKGSLTQEAADRRVEIYDESVN